MNSHNGNGTHHISADLSQIEIPESPESIFDIFEKENLAKKRRGPDWKDKFEILLFLRQADPSTTMSLVEDILERYPVKFAERKRTQADDNEADEDVVSEAKEELEQQALKDKQAQTKAEIGASLDLPAVTPNALVILNKMSPIAERVYTRLCTFTDTYNGETKKRSRKEWAEFCHISRATWYRTEKMLKKAGLIVQTDNRLGYQIDTRFTLPMIKEWQTPPSQK